MKTKIIIVITLILCIGQTYAQITLEKTGEHNSLNNENYAFYDNEGNTKYIKEEKYLKNNGLVNYNGTKFSILNEDLSIYKVVDFPTTLMNSNDFKNIEIHLTNFEFMDPQGYEKKMSATINYFNSDSKIEFLISYFYSNTFDDVVYFTKLINEDGVEIRTFGGSLNPLSNTERFVVSNEFTKSQDSLFIAKPGILPCFSCKSQTVGISPISPTTKLLNIQSAPNPTYGFVTLNYSLPENVSDGQIFFYSQQGEKLKEFKVHNDINQIGFHTGEYSPGIYFYELVANGMTSGGKKMVVLK